MLLPNTHEQSALIVANQLRQAIEKTGFNASGVPLPLPFPAALLSLLKAILMRLHLIVQTALFIRLKIRVATNVV